MKTQIKKWTPKTQYLRASAQDLLWTPDYHVVDRLNKKYGYALIDQRMVTRAQTIIIELSYPLDGPFEFTYRSRAGWSMARLVAAIQKAYKKVYKSDKSEDAYGVWGHYIEDLVIESIEVRKVGRKVYIIPMIAS